MNICVIGTGYVGLVAGTCFADLGNHVICVDVDEKKVEKLKKAKSPIYEPGLEEMVARNVKEGRLSFTTNTADSVKKSKAIFIAVGTPEADDGMADLRYVREVAEAIGKAMNGEKVVVNKSTVPVGTGDIVRDIIKKHYKGTFHVVSNPEFLREGAAINDFLHPDRVVVGNGDPAAEKIMRELYGPLKCPILFTNVRTAEMIKYASNAFLATKISFINQVSRLCDNVDADVKMVSKGMSLDKRIGKHFLEAGAGWGGSCFPKDVRALAKIGEKHGVDMSICSVVDEVNEEQKAVPVQKAKELLGGLEGKTVTLLGLAFKPNTDDMRNASAIKIASLLQKEGAKVRGIDPVAEEEARKVMPDIEYFDDVYKALSGADAMILVTEWNEFKELDFEKIKGVMRKPLVVDGRNIYDRAKLEGIGFTYSAIGR